MTPNLRIQDFFGMLFCILLGKISGLMSYSPSSLWYASLATPWFTPPAWVFAPVWTLLYACMGLILVKLWQTRHERPFWFGLFVIQLGLNLLWSPLFFLYQRVDLAFYTLLALWTCVASLTFMSRKCDRYVFILLLPYILWLSLALTINFYIFVNN